MELTFSEINLAISAAGLVICLLGLMMALMDSSPERRTRQFFVAFFSVLAAYVAASLIGQCSDGRRFQEATLFLESAFSSVLPVMLTGFLLEQSGETGWLRSRNFLVAAGLWIVYFALLLYAQFSVTIYYFDVLGEYHRGAYYPVLLVPPVLIMAWNLLLLWRRRKHYSHKQLRAFSIYIIVPLLTMLVQMLFFGIYAIVLGTAVSALFMFLSIQNEQMERHAKQEAENTRLRMDMMLSQIQPHFLYNTLSVIQDLCHTGDCARAEDATFKFARYLRGNMASLAADAPVPFEQELEHTQGYLELEQMRFREELTVRYDIGCTAFRIPTLTLQPIAENAVRHGVRGNPDGRGTVVIASREYPDRYEVTVTDDGPGFDSSRGARSDGSAHIGLANVRERLARMCGGTLTVASGADAGTTVTITIPKEDTPC